jgi:4-methyl-5(b-hydroxyethyl)-thiazole monophosphate biosynthesis
MKKIAVFFAESYEEIEALTVVDMCRRADIQTEMISVTDSLTVTGAHAIPVKMDKMLSEVDFDALDMIVLPGGWPGTPNLEKVADFMEKVKVFAESGKYVAAICAAPSILGHLGILAGKTACCFPGFEEELTGASVSYNSCEVDGNIITARGMGCAIDFSVEIIRVLSGSEKAEEIASKIIYKK